MICVALFMQYALNLKPCILCHLQRFCVILLFCISFLAFIQKGYSLRVYRIFLTGALISSFLGIVFSSRQLYLQSLPADLVPSCVPDLDYLVSTLPILDVVLIAIQGDGNCAEVLWTFLGISIPGWTFIGFIIVSSYLIVALIFSNQIHSRFSSR